MTRQHSIDLLPRDIYAQSQAGLRMGRFGAASAVVIVLLVIAATHSRFMLRNAQMDLFHTSAQASQALETEAKASQLKKKIADMQQFTVMYEQAAFPLELSAVLATVVQKLPPSVTLDQLDLNAGVTQATRSPRSKGATKTTSTTDGKGELPPPRLLNGEISGFAASDQHIAELVSRLKSTPPFRNVSWDFSRTRQVHGHSAREFRLSFRIDLDATYQLKSAQGTERASAPTTEDIHVQ